MHPELERTYHLQKQRVRYVLVLAGVVLVALLFNAGAEIWLMGQSGKRLLVSQLDAQAGVSASLAGVLDSLVPDSGEERVSLEMEAWESGHAVLRRSLGGSAGWGVPAPQEPEAAEASAPLDVESTYGVVTRHWRGLIELVLNPEGPPPLVELQRVTGAMTRALASYRGRIEIRKLRLTEEVLAAESRATLFRLFPLIMALIGGCGLLVEGILVLLPVLGILRQAQDFQAVASVPAESPPLEPTHPDVSESELGLKARFLAHLEGSLRHAASRIIEETERLESTGLATQQQAHAKSVRVAAEGIRGAIATLLDFSKIESGDLDVDSTPFDLREAVEDALEWISDDAHARDINLVLQMNPSIASGVKGDAERVRQVVANLVSNAVRFSDRGSDVVVKVSENGDGGDERRFRISIRDRGRGIEPAALEELLQDAASADPGSTETGGVGLPLSHRIARLLGGELGAESEPGEGSTFWFTASFEANPAATPASLEVKELPERATVLLVDACAVLRRSLGELVEGMGFKVIDTESAKGASGLLRSTRGQRSIVAMLVDASLPELQIVDLVRAVKTTLSLSHVNVILLCRAQRDRPAISPDWIACQLRKPVRLTHLREALGNLQYLSSDLGVTPAEEPAVADKKPSRQKRVNEAPKPLFHALVAESNPVLQRVAQRMLEKMRCTVDLAPTGREVLDAVQAVNYSFVLLDIELSDMHGIDITTALRKFELKVGTRVPVVGMIPQQSKVKPRRCLDAGMDACIQKPVKSKDLLTLLKKLHGLRSRRDSVRPGSRRGDPRKTEPSDELALVALMQLGEGKDPSFVLNTVDRFIGECTALIDTIRTAQSKGDAERVGKSASDLKSKCSVLGAITMARMSQEIAERAARGHDAKLDGAIDELEAEFNRVRQTLASKLAELTEARREKAAAS